MRDNTLSFIVRSFKKYYDSVRLDLPERLSRREFGFMFFDRDFFLRHIGFKNRRELQSYLVEHAPSHVYHSSAYYKNPNAQSMTEKGWMGADLVFDLDADHVRNASALSYPEMLERVKEELIRLLDEYVMGDLGFDEASLRIVFSGGRGYHVHVRDQRVRSLGSHERREIVDYITGTGLDFDWIFPQSVFDATQFGRRTQVKRRRVMPSREDGGWRGRMASGMGRFLMDLEAIGEDEAVRRFATMRGGSGRAIGERAIRGMYRELFESRGGSERGVDRMRRENNLEVFSRQLYLTAFLELVEEHVKVSLVGETDEPVTSDVKRLIRLPTSLHGKTGLVVTPLSRDSLVEFDPLRDAVPDFLGDAAVRVEPQAPTDMTLRGERFLLDEGATEVPEFAALYLACRGLVKIL